MERPRAALIPSIRTESLDAGPPEKHQHRVVRVRWTFVRLARSSAADGMSSLTGPAA